MAPIKRNLTTARAGAEREAEEAKAPKRPKKLPFFAPLAALALFVSVPAGALIAVGPEGMKEIFTGPPQDGEARVVEPTEATHHYVALPQNIYELTAGEAGARYLMASVTLEIPIPFKETADLRREAMEGVFQAYIRSLSPADLQGAGGLYTLRQGLLHRARRVLGEEAVSDVFISEILVG